MRNPIDVLPVRENHKFTVRSAHVRLTLDHKKTENKSPSGNTYHFSVATLCVLLEY